MSEVGGVLERAWKRRAPEAGGDAVRVFHGPGDAGVGTALADWAIDLFGAYAWVTAWGRDSAETRDRIRGFLEGKGVRGAVLLVRPEKGVPGDPCVLYGAPPAERYPVAEGKGRYGIRLLGTKHPGLFLDHAPLRRWLGAAPRGSRVLNGFSYTGSLSVAAALGGAEHVTSLDLSKPYTQWARENWELNDLPPERADFIFGDVFEWLPKLRKNGRRFDCAILDPPSFSRGVKGSFSTARDLQRLHELAFRLLEPRADGVATLITSINSANVSSERYWQDVSAAAAAASFRLRVITPIEAPVTFTEPRPYLKGWIIEARPV